MKANLFTGVRGKAKIKVAKKLPEPLAEEARNFLRYHSEGSKSTEHFREIVRSAEGLLRRRFPRKSTVIFAGQGMHPLFRAVVWLNKHHMRRPAGFFRYFAAPPWNGHQSTAALIAEKLRSLKIVSDGTKNYYIADVSSSGRTYAAIEEAILHLNPKAKVSLLSGPGITSSDLLERHAVKDSEGRLKRKNGGFATAQSLAFRLYLEEYLASRKPRTGLLALIFGWFGK